MEAKLAKCPRCGNLFSKINFPVCIPCQPEEEEDYEKIRDILVEKPGLSARELAEESGVPLDCVMRMIDQGQLSNADLADPVKCGRCGAPAISPSKRLCGRCLVKLERDCMEAMRSMAPFVNRSTRLKAHYVRRSVDEKRGVE